MPGIIVGVDGSDHSLSALDWALNEADLRKTPLTVITVSPIVTGIYGPGYAPADYSRPKRKAGPSRRRLRRNW